MAPMALDEPAPAVTQRQRALALPPPTLYPVKDTQFEKYTTPQYDGREAAVAHAQPDGSPPVIVIDNGSSTVRAGWSFEKNPRIVAPPIMAKYRERKLGKTFSFVGTDCYADTTARGHIRNAFEAGSGLVTNWDVMEHVLDYLFIKLGMNGVEGAIDMPVVMTEAVANLPYSRKSMTEIIFECYGAPSLAYGIDSLFSYRHNKGNTGLVVSSSYSSTHVIPVYNQKALLAQATRLNWGGWHEVEYLRKLLRLKYPSLAPKISFSQVEHMLRDFSYVSMDYENEVRSYLDWTGLEDRERIIQYPYTEDVIVQKTEEELAKAAERKKESGRRLQEQAAKMRLEKLMVKEQNLEYYKDVQRRLVDQNKKETKRILDDAEMRDEAQLEKVIKDLERNIRRARQKDLGGEQEEEQQEAPVFDLVDVPDDQLDEAGLKQKRHQRLLKSNYDARARAKAEKEAEKARVEAAIRADEDRRTNELEGWLADKHKARLDTLQKIKDRERMKKDLGNRKTLASQMRMKNIANLASDNPTGGSRKRRRGGDDDDFGADDADWGVYRDIAQKADDDDTDDEEGGEDLDATVVALEQELLQYDPHFTYEDTREAQNDWSQSLLHAFYYGPRPHNDASAAERNQLHLNVERIRVPEVIFQPSAIAGVDQAGLIEIAGEILTNRLSGMAGQDAFLRDVFLTGGNTLFQNFDERLRAGLTALLPAGSPLVLRRAHDPLLDAWKGAADWAGSAAWRAATVTREEYQEKGAEYIKEHDMGNAFA